MGKVVKETSEFYDKEAANYDNLRWISTAGAYTNSVQKRIVAQLLGEVAGKNIFEIGCGTGRFTTQLIDMGAKIHAHVFMPLPGSVFENESPGILDQETRRQLGDLARRHLLTGSWSHQELLGKELASKEDMSKR